jgi:hypothetical protein
MIALQEAGQMALLLGIARSAPLSSWMFCLYDRMVLGSFQLRGLHQVRWIYRRLRRHDLAPCGSGQSFPHLILIAFRSQEIPR